MRGLQVLSLVLVVVLVLLVIVNGGALLPMVEECQRAAVFLGIGMGDLDRRGSEAVAGHTESKVPRHARAPTDARPASYWRQ